MAHILLGSLLLLVAGSVALRHHGRHFGWRRLISKLDASPAQERALRDLFLSTRDQLRQLHVDSRALREEMGEVVRGDKFDAARFMGAEAKAGEKFRQATGIIRTTLEQVHEVLDAEQRAKVAHFITSGTRCHRFSHC